MPPFNRSQHQPFFENSYGSIKSQLLADDEEGALTAAQQLCATFGAGAFTTLVANPMSVVKTRLVMAQRKGLSAAAVLANLVKTEGIRGMYKVRVVSRDLVRMSHDQH